MHIDRMSFIGCCQGFLTTENKLAGTSRLKCRKSRKQLCGTAVLTAETTADSGCYNMYLIFCKTCNITDHSQIMKNILC